MYRHGEKFQDPSSNRWYTYDAHNCQWYRRDSFDRTRLVTLEEDREQSQFASSYAESHTGQGQSTVSPWTTRNTVSDSTQGYRVRGPRDSGIGVEQHRSLNGIDEESEQIITASPEHRISGTQDRDTESTAGSGGGDHKFKVRNDHKRFFIFGRVFQCCWNEEFSGRAKDKAVAWVTENACGQPIYAKYRYFVVIDDNENHSSQCLPIVTHGGRGVGHLVKEHHSIIYSGKNEPLPLDNELSSPGENGMRRSIRVKLQSKRDRLQDRSRINFKMSFPIQHNIKVYDMGMVHGDFLNILWEEYRAVNTRTVRPDLRQIPGQPIYSQPSPQTAQYSQSYSELYQDSPYANTQYSASYPTGYPPIQAVSTYDTNSYAEEEYDPR